jgi:phosphotransferase system enzyme I (PtsP)
MGGRTLEAMALIGIGLTRFSITPVAVGPIKAMIRSLDRAQLLPEMEAMLDSPPPDMRTALTQWAADKGVSIG